MTYTIHDQLIALAGAAQIAYWVQQLAQTGVIRAEQMQFATDVIFNRNPDDVAQVFGG